MNTLALLLCSPSLWYTRPAPDTDKGWECESLPLGCGWFGISCFGGVTNKRLQITHNTVLTMTPKHHITTQSGTPVDRLQDTSQG